MNISKSRVIKQKQSTKDVPCYDTNQPTRISLVGTLIVVRRSGLPDGLKGFRKEGKGTHLSPEINRPIRVPFSVPKVHADVHLHGCT
jgi:hypothetical protein